MGLLYTTLMIKTVIFDVGGVLHWHDGNKILDDISAYFDVPRQLVAQHWANLIPLLGSGQIDEATFWKHFQQAIGTHKPLPPDSLLTRGLRDSFKKNTEIFEYIKDLKRSGIKTAILSNSIEAHADFLRSQGLYDDFDPVLLSYQIGMRKPGVQIFRYALEQLGITASETILIDDDPKNIEAAESLEIRSILYTNVASLKSQLSHI